MDNIIEKLLEKNGIEYIDENDPERFPTDESLICSETGRAIGNNCFYIIDGKPVCEEKGKEIVKETLQGIRQALENKRFLRFMKITNEMERDINNG